MENTRKFTRNLMAKFPSWMKMAKDPMSVGAQFLDVFGVTLEEFKDEMDYVAKNFYIETADIEMVDIMYKIPLSKETILDFESQDIHATGLNENPEVFIKHKEGDSQEVSMVRRVRHLYHKDASLPVGLANRDDGYLYLRINMDSVEDKNNPFQYIEINEARHYTIEYHHVWNAFDEFGFLLGLNRLHLERNKDYKERILDVFRNPGSSTNKGIVNGVARELGINKESVKVTNLNESVYSEELVAPDGTPTKKMREYAKGINDNLKFAIDTLNLGEAYWQSIENNNLGIHFLPHIWDIDETLFETEEFQSGIGYGDDLKVNKPNIEESTIRDFRLNVSLIGYYEDFEEFFPEVSFQYKIYAKGKLLEDSYEEEPFKFTIQAAEDFEQKYSLTATQKFNYLHRVMFNDKKKFKDNNDIKFIHFGKSNDFLNNQKNPIQRLSMYLDTSDEYQSNKIPEMKVVWEGKDGNEYDFVYKTRDQWINPQSNNQGTRTSTIVTSGTYYDRENEVFELGRGNFNEEIRTTSDFMQGRYDTNFVTIQNGEIKLNFESINQIKK